MQQKIIFFVKIASLYDMLNMISKSALNWMIYVGK